MQSFQQDERLSLLLERERRKREHPLRYSGYHRGQALWMADKHQIVGVVGGNWSAKALSLDTDIPTPNGWKTMADIHVGDSVFGSDGRPCRVVIESPVTIGNVCYRVMFNNGDSIVCDAGHLWETETLNYRKNKARSGDKTASTPSVVTTEELRDALIGRQGKLNHAVRVCEPVRYGERDLLIPPYVLGAWLGDGSKENSYLTYAESDSEILVHLAEAGASYQKIGLESRNGVMRVCLGLDIGGKEVRLISATRSLGLWKNKHIPSEYMTASLEQRIELIQGLMDTDGTVNKLRHHCSFANTNRRIADGLYELLCSVGIRPTMSVGRAKLNGKDCGAVYRIYFCSNMPVFKMSRKADMQAKRTGNTYNRSSRRYVSSVERVESVPVKCIGVDSDSHLFLATRSYIPTHNSHWLGMTLAGAITGDYPIPGLMPEPPFPVIVLGKSDVFRDKIQPITRQYLPPGFITGGATVSSWQCYSLWKTALGGTVRFHSFESDEIEGVEYGLLLCDEPPPERILNSVKSRLRDEKMMALHGFGAMQRFAFTPLQAGAYLHDQFGPDYNRETTAVYNVPIWVNCTCLAGLDAERLKRFGFNIGLASEHHPDDCRCNGGYRTQAEIKSYLRTLAPLERPWRESGEWMLVERRKFPMFVDAEPYVFNPMKQAGYKNAYPLSGTVYVGCDPHGERPDAIVIGVCNPDGSIDWVDELPDYEEGDFQGVYFDAIHNYYRPTSIVVKALVKKLKAIALPIGAMVMDPFRGAQHLGDNGEKVVDIFNAELDKQWPGGPTFMVAAPDKDDGYSVDAGERMINDLLYYDVMQPDGISNRPRWRFSSRCHNTRRALLNYRVKQSRSVDDEAKPEKAATGFKDFIDPLRYVQMLDPVFIRQYSEYERAEREYRRRPPSARVA